METIILRGIGCLFPSVIYVFLHDACDVYCAALKPRKHNFHQDSRWCSIVLCCIITRCYCLLQYLSLHLPETQHHRQYVTYNPQGDRMYSVILLLFHVVSWFCLLLLLTPSPMWEESLNCNDVKIQTLSARARLG